MNDHTGHPLTSLSNLPRDSYDQEQQDRLADLRSQLVAAVAARATWQQRATSAEADAKASYDQAAAQYQRAEELGGELAVLRQALDARQATFDHAMRCLECAEPEEQCDESMELEEIATKLHAQARDGTYRSAQLGALVEAALAVAVAEKRYRAAKRNGERDEALAQLHKANDRLIAAADAVLASEVRT